jgi:hypothetical protein
MNPAPPTTKYRCELPFSELIRNIWNGDSSLARQLVEDSVSPMLRLVLS